MQMEIKLHHSLHQQVLSAEEGLVEVSPGQKIEVILEQFGINQEGVVIVLNKRIVPKETVIQEEGCIEVYPLVLGG